MADTLPSDDILPQASQDLMPLGRHHEGVLELGRKLAIPRDRGPSVRKHLHCRPTEIDHRLDSEQHTGLQHHTFAGLAVVEDVRSVVEHAAKAVAAGSASRPVKAITRACFTEPEDASSKVRP